MRYYKGRFFIRAFLTYFLLIGLLVSIFGILLSRQRRVDTQQLLAQEMQAKGERMVQIIDDKFDMIELTTYQLSNSSWMPYVASRSSVLYSLVSPSQKWNICEEIAQQNDLLQIGNNIAVMFPDKDLVVDGIGFWEEEHWLDTMNLDMNLVDRINDMYPSFYSTLFLLTKTEPEKGDGFVIAKKMRNESQSKGIFLMQVDDKQFTSYLETYLPEALSFSIVQNEQVIYETSLLESPKNAQELVISSNVYNWDYLITVEPDETTELWPFAQTIVVIICLITVTCFVAYGLVRVTELPITKLVRRFDRKSEERLYGLDKLEYIFDELNLEKDKMEGLAKQYLSIGQNNLLNSIISGTYNRSLVEENIRKFQIDLRPDWLYVVVVFENFTSENKEAILDELLNLEANFSQGGITSTICYQEESKGYVLIMGMEKENEPFSNHGENLAVLLDEYLVALDVDVYIGQPHKGIDGIYLSYVDAYHQMLWMNNQKEQLYYYYPTAVEQKINSQLRLGNFGMTEQLLQHVEEENKKRQVLIDVERKLIYVLFESLIRFASEKGISEKQWQEEYLYVSKSNNISDMWCYLYELLTDIQHRIRDNSDMVKGMQIVKYVNEHYRSSSLSQIEIAEFFGMSRSTISKVFKEATQLNFVDYVCKLRVDYAKQLIAQGNSSISSLAKESGYETEISLKRAFLKQEGITPREYIKRVSR